MWNVREKLVLKKRVPSHRIKEDHSVVRKVGDAAQHRIVVGRGDIRG